MTSSAGLPLRSLPCLALAALSLAGQASHAQVAPRPVVRGIVFDSTTMRPLRGARVQLVALPVHEGPRVAGTDSSGNFEFDSLSLGSYLLGFTHPRLDSLGLEPSLVRVDLRTPGTIVAPLAVPSAGSLVRSACKVDLRRDSTGIFRGYARSARDGFPVPKARLRLEWPEFIVRRGSLERTTRAIDAQANDEGRYLVCGVPLGTTVLIRARAGADSSGVVELEMPDNGLLRRDILLGDASHAVDYFERGATTASADSGSARTVVTDTVVARATRRDSALVGRDTVASERASPRIRGVVQASNGTSVVGARVRLLGSSSDATTIEDGSFVLSNVASGTQMIEVRALGYKPRTVAVDVMGSGEATAQVELEGTDAALGTGVTALDTMRVSGRSRLSEAALQIRQSFAHRRQSGVGSFLTDSMIRARAPHLPSELFRGMPGLTVTSGSGGQGVYMRASATFTASKGLCLPTVFLDGVRAPRAPVDQMAIVSDMRAVEIYARVESAPTQYQTSDGCGALVIWTRTMWDASRFPPPNNTRARP